MLIVGSIRSECFKGEDCEGRALGGKMPCSFYWAVTKPAEGSFPGDFLFVCRMIAEVGEGGNVLCKKGCLFSGKVEDVTGF